MKISKKTKNVKKNHPDCEFVCKYGQQYKRVGLHFYLYRSGTWCPISWFSDQLPKKLWKINIGDKHD